METHRDAGRTGWITELPVLRIRGEGRHQGKRFMKGGHKSAMDSGKLTIWNLTGPALLCGKEEGGAESKYNPALPLFPLNGGDFEVARKPGIRIDPGPERVKNDRAG